MYDPRAESLRFARVVRLYHDSADVVFVDDGFHAPRVPLLRGFMTSDAGTFDQPEPTPVTDELRLNDSSGRVMMAVIGFVKGYPVILGTLAPATCAMLFEANRYVHRLPSDVVVTGDPDGNVEVFHPSGTYIRIGENPAHDDLTGKDLNKRFKLTRNTERAVGLTAVIANGGEERARLQVDPSGNVVLDHDGNLQVETRGNAAIDVTGALDADVGGAATVTAASLTINAPTTINGNLTVNGSTTLNGSVAASGGGFTHEGSNVGATHTHPGVMSGGASTGPPA